MKTVRYARKFNIGNYETEDLEMSIEIAKDQDEMEVMKLLKKKIEKLQEEFRNGEERRS